MSVIGVRRLGVVLLAVGLPFLLVGLGLTVAGWVAVQDILADDEVDEGTKARAESSFYMASTGILLLGSGATAALAGSLVLGLTSPPATPPARPISRRISF